MPEWKVRVGEDRIDLYSLDLPALEDLLASWGESPTTARQVWHGLYRDFATGPEQIESLPPRVRQRLVAETTVCLPAVKARQEDPGGETRKDLLELADGEQVEVVLLRYGERRSACISTQVGCACGCRFCATGQMGFVRHLTTGEIVAQVLHVQRELAARGRRLTNVVLMGMGEPLLNYDRTLSAVRRLVDPRGVALSPGRITLSTVGIVPGIERLAAEDLPIKLAVSLHAATDALRSHLVPVSRRHPLDHLFAALRRYTERTQRRVMLEWVMIAGVNHAPAQAEALAARLAGMRAHVNLIRLNPTQGYEGRSASPAALEAFAAVLDRAGVPHTVRQRRGRAICAGCGQLRSRAGSD